MRTIAVVLMLLAGPACAADYTPWPARDLQPVGSFVFELVQQKDACCKHCTKGKPCGNTCIGASSKCNQPPGCAC